MLAERVGTRGDEGGHLQGGVHWYRFCCMLAERVGQEEMSGVTCRVVCTGIGFAVEEPWLAPCGTILAYCLNRLKNATQRH